MPQPGEPLAETMLHPRAENNGLEGSENLELT